MRKKKVIKKKLPKKIIRKKSSVKNKKRKTGSKSIRKSSVKRKRGRPLKKRKYSKTLFKVKKVKTREDRGASKNNSPIFNISPNFLDESNNVEELLNEVEVNDQDSILIKDFSLSSSVEPENKREGLERLIFDDYLVAEDIVGDSNYKLEIREDEIKIKKSKKIQHKSQHLINLRDTKEKKVKPIINEFQSSNIVKKRTIKNISSLYLREIIFLGSQTKFFKFTNFLGESISGYGKYLFWGIQKFLKLSINLFLSFLSFINFLGARFYKLFSSAEDRRAKITDISSKTFKDKINNWKLRVNLFNPFLIFRFSSLKTYSRLLSFLLICLLIISSIQVMALVGKFNISKGKVLGISEQAFGDFNDGLQSMISSDFNEAKDNFLNANQKFLVAEGEILNYNNIFVEILKFVPQEGKKLDYGLKFLNAGKLFSEAAEHISLALEEQNEENKLTDKIILISSHLKQSKDKLKKISQDIQDIDLKSLPFEYQEKFSSLQKNIPNLIDNLEDLDSLLDLVSDILGGQRPQRYLLLFQNSNELRASGGFIGSLALLDIKGGQIENIKVPEGGPYDLKAGFFENVISPKPLWLINPNLNFWDANWFADFPTSAQLILKYWEKSGGPTVDGVITINSDVMVEFLKIIGSIDLAERNLEINSDNFIEEVQRIVEIEDVGSAPKAIIGEMMSEILERVFNDQKLDYLKTLKLFNDSLVNKNIQLYFTNLNLESAIMNYGWGGRMQDTSGDYLAIINTNIGGGKTDKFVKEKVGHNVKILSNGTIIDTLKIKRNFIKEKNNIFSQQTNRTYLRIYVPAGVKLLEANGFEEFPEEEYMIPVYGSKEDEQIKEIQGRYVIDELSGVKINNEFNKTVFSGWQELNPGQEKIIILRYELPFKLNLNRELSFLDKFFKQKDSLNLDTYTVFYEKQSGKDSQLDLSYEWSEEIDLAWSNFLSNHFQTIFDKNKIIGLVLKK